MVPGALFEVDAAGEALLDQKEGAPKFYARREVFVVDAAGGERAAITYVVTDARTESHHVPPTDAYLQVVRRGLDSHGLSTEPLERAARRLGGEPWPGAAFVYGTLRKGESRGAVLGGARTSAALRGQLVDCGDYPGLVLGGAGWVVGERVAIDAVDLARLDAIEGFVGYGASGSLFRRVVVPLKESGWAWSYLWLGEAGRPIASGDWPAWRERRGGDLL